MTAYLAWIEFPCMKTKCKDTIVQYSVPQLQYYFENHITSSSTQYSINEDSVCNLKHTHTHYTAI